MKLHRIDMKIRSAVSKITFVVFVLVIGYRCINSYAHDTKKMQSKIKDIKEADSYRDVMNSISKGDRRFVGVYGATLAVPGIADGQFNSIVQLQGIKPIEGTTDFIEEDQQWELNSVAGEYALKYNLILLKNILNKPDKETRNLLAQIREELRSFENADAIADSLKAFKAGSGRFIVVSGEGIKGVPEGGLTMIVQKTGTRLIKANTIVLNDAEKKRFRRVMKDYITPYNENLYHLIERKAKHGKH